MYKWVLVPLDGSPHSEGVIPYARQVARRLALPLTLLHVVDPGVIQAPAPQHRAALAQLTQRAADLAEARLKPLAGALNDAGLQARPRVLYGNPAETILSCAKEEDGCLLAMATHGRSGLGRWLLGSVADRVLHCVEGPLLLIRPGTQPGAAEEAPLQTMLIPLDGSEMAESILPQAEEVARSLGLRILIIQVVPSMSDLYLGPEMYPYPTDILLDAEAAAASYVREIAERISRRGLQVDSRAVVGHAAGSIIDLAHELPGALVAMCTHGRSGLSRALLGSVAGRVVRSARGPVLLIRRSEEA